MPFGKRGNKDPSVIIEEPAPSSHMANLLEDIDARSGSQVDETYEDMFRNVGIN